MLTLHARLLGVWVLVVLSCCSVLWDACKALLVRDWLLPHVFFLVELLLDRGQLIGCADRVSRTDRLTCLHPSPPNDLLYVRLQESAGAVARSKSGASPLSPLPPGAYSPKPLLEEVPVTTVTSKTVA